MFKHLYAIITASILFVIILITGTLLVNLLMNKLVAGRDVVIVPELIGVDFQKARDYCKSISLKMEIIDEEHHEFPQGVITSQMPSPHRTVFKNRIVQTVVSKGPKQVIVPNLIGFFYYDIEELLKSYDLKLGDVSQHYSSEIPAGHVINSNPSAGTTLMAGKKVNIILSIGHDPLEIEESENFEEFPAEDSLKYFEDTIF